MIASYLLLSVLFSIAAVYVDLARGTTTPEQLQAGQAPFSPVSLLAVNLAAAAMILDLRGCT